MWKVVQDFTSFKTQFTSQFRVKADDDEEMIDPHDTLKDECRDHHCKNLYAKLEECNTRVNSKQETSETCAEEIFDLFGCIDHCVAPKLFSKLK